MTLSFTTPRRFNPAHKEKTMVKVALLVKLEAKPLATMR